MWNNRELENLRIALADAVGNAASRQIKLNSAQAEIDELKHTLANEEQLLLSKDTWIARVEKMNQNTQLAMRDQEKSSDRKIGFAMGGISIVWFFIVVLVWGAGQCG